MEIPDALVNLAESLNYAQVPYNLLLTSTISLTPEVLQKICGSDQWDAFGNHLRGFPYNHRINLLQRHLSGHNNADGYQSLAHLIEQKVFSTMLTTNLDSTLEDMLSRLSSPYRALVVGRDRSEHIANALDSDASDIRIIKLQGSLRDGVLSEDYPYFIELKETITSGLSRYINQDIVIIGSIEREDDIISLHPRGKGSIYYIVPDNHVPNDKVTRIIHARNYELDKFVIYGYFGQFERFCKTLESLLTNPATSRKDESIIRNQSTQASLPISARPPRLYTPIQSVEIAYPPAQSSVEQRKPESSAILEPQEKEPSSTGGMVIKIVSGVLAIGALLVAVSLFINLTPSFNSAFIIPLIIILAVIILGIMGILRADQIVQIFLQGLTVKASSDSADSTEAAKTATSTKDKPALPPTSTQTTPPSPLTSEEVQAASSTDDVLPRKIEQSAEPVVQQPTANGSSRSAPDRAPVQIPPTSVAQPSIPEPLPSLESMTQVQPAQIEEEEKETTVTIEPETGLEDSIPVLSPKSQNDKIKLVNTLYKQIWQAKSDIIYASHLFDRGKTASDQQFDRLSEFLNAFTDAPSNLLETINLLPEKISPWRYPMREALSRVVTLTGELKALISRPNRVALNQEIQQKFLLLADTIDKVTVAFRDLCTRFQDETW